MDKGKSTVSSGRMRCLKVLGFVAVLIGLATIQVAAQETRAGEAPATGDVARGTWRVRVKQGSTSFLTVRANEAPLTQVAAEIHGNSKCRSFLVE